MKDIVIKFRGRKNITAKVTLSKKQFDQRMYGLIQYLANLCSVIEWEVVK